MVAARLKRVLKVLIKLVKLAHLVLCQLQEAMQPVTATVNPPKALFGYRTSEFLNINVNVHIFFSVSEGQPFPKASVFCPFSAVFLVEVFLPGGLPRPLGGGSFATWCAAPGTA